MATIRLLDKLISSILTVSCLQEMERLLGINSDSPGANDLFDTTAAR